LHVSRIFADQGTEKVNETAFCSFLDIDWSRDQNDINLLIVKFVKLDFLTVAVFFFITRLQFATVSWPLFMFIVWSRVCQYFRQEQIVFCFFDTLIPGPANI
jgi:hypothetical protein